VDTSRPSLRTNLTRLVKVPSLKNAKKLVVKGKVVLSAGTSFAGDVAITNAADEWKTLPAGDYKDQTVEL